MNKKLISFIIILFFISFVAIFPQISLCQTATSTPTSGPTPTPQAGQGSTFNLLLIGGIIAVVVVAIGVSTFLVTKRRVNETTLRKYSTSNFQDWVIKKFNGKPSDPSSGVDAFTEGGQPLLIKQTDHVGLAEVEDFVKVLARERPKKAPLSLSILTAIPSKEE